MNLANWLYEFLRGISTDNATNIFLVIMLAAFSGSVWSIVYNRLPAFVRFAPALLTMLGILGTFFGIAVGLVNFDVENIDGSIPLLLEGLKTAFITSIMGMSLAILNQLLQHLPIRHKAEIEPESIGPEEIHGELVKQNASLTTVVTQLGSLKSAIAGEGEATVVTQLQKIRTAMQDDLGELKTLILEEFQKFAAQVSELGSKQIVEALKEVMSDFNNKLPEQFGENFARLDESVKKMLEWQQEYKAQVATLTEQFNQSVEGIAAARESLSGIAEQTAKIPKHLEHQSEVLDALDGEVIELEQLLETYVIMRGQALEAMPEIRRRIDEVMDAMREAVKKAGDHYEIMLSDADHTHQQFQTQARTMIEASAKTLEDTHHTLLKGCQRIADQTVKGAEDVQRAASTKARNVRMPEVGMDIQATNGAIIYSSAELVWPNDQIVVLLSEDKDSLTLSKVGWDVLTVGEAMYRLRVFPSAHQGYFQDFRA